VPADKTLKNVGKVIVRSSTVASGEQDIIVSRRHHVPRVLTGQYHRYWLRKHQATANQNGEDLGQADAALDGKQYSRA
jgi:hypothetical protein